MPAQINADWDNGFIIGYQLIMGTNAGIPGIPGQPGIPGNSTEFHEGIKAGTSAAGHQLNKK